MELKKYLEQKFSGKSQKEIARLCGLSESEISLIFHGKRNPQLQTLEKIAKGVGVSLPRLIEELMER